MQLTKVVLKKTSELLLANLTERKLKKKNEEIRTKQNDAILSWVARKGLGPT